MGILGTVAEAEFSVLRERLEVSDSVLSKHLSALVEEDYIAVRKAFRGGRRSTWAKVTPRGSRALADHVAALQAIASGAI
jgi:DNA-binding MarR family transcriptional regulator